MQISDNHLILNHNLLQKPSFSQNMWGSMEENCFLNAMALSCGPTNLVTVPAA